MNWNWLQSSNYRLPFSGGFLVTSCWHYHIHQILQTWLCVSNKVRWLALLLLLISNKDFNYLLHNHSTKWKYRVRGTYALYFHSRKSFVYYSWPQLRSAFTFKMLFHLKIAYVYFLMFFFWSKYSWNQIWKLTKWAYIVLPVEVAATLEYGQTSELWQMKKFNWLVKDKVVQNNLFCIICIYWSFLYHILNKPYLGILEAKWRQDSEVSVPSVQFC